MTNIAVIGMQWGDEGKAKVVEYLTRYTDAIARMQGGHNAGHTIIHDGEKFIFHLVPSGIFHPRKLCLIGNGVVLDPGAFFNEIDRLGERGCNPDGRLFLSDRCHIIFPYHFAIEKCLESRLGKKKIGTTLRGIGPAYADKISRSGIRLADLLDAQTAPDTIRFAVERNNALLSDAYQSPVINPDDVVEKYMAYAARLRPYAADTGAMLDKLFREKKSVLFEGSQGALLDIDHGTYPYVTSASVTAGGISTGLGIPPRSVNLCVGIAKAYATRVGSGPFPTEAEPEMAESLRKRGAEFGSTTGRPRRCGWLDLIALKYAVRINGIDAVALTKLDVLDGVDPIQVGIAYDLDGERIDFIPASQSAINRLKPVYMEMPGWSHNTAGASRMKDLPENAIAYIRMIEKELGIPVTLVSTGSASEHTIIRPPLVDMKLRADNQPNNA